MVNGISPQLQQRLEQRARAAGCTLEDLLTHWLDHAPTHFSPRPSIDISYKELLDHARDIIVLFDRDFRHVYVNPYVEVITGIPPEELIGKTNREMGMPAEQVQFWDESIAAVFESGKERTIEFDFTVAGDPHFFEAQLSPIFGSGDTAQYVMTITRDITERRRAEEELRESEIRLRHTQSIAHVGYWEWNMQTGENIWSDEFCRICGVDPETTQPSLELGFSLIHPEDRARAQKAIEASQEQRKPYHIEKRIVRPDGETRWVLSDGKISFDENDQPLKLAGTFLDITERKKDQDQALEAALEKMRVNIIAGFIRDASHEFRSPLTLINTQLYLMSRTEQLEKRQHYANNIMLQVERIIRLVQMLTRIVELESHSIQCDTQIDVPSLVSMLCHQLQLARKPNQAEILFIDDAHPGLATIQGASDYLIDAFRQILDNALRFTAADGRIIVRVVEEGQNVVVKVKDSGMGIPEWAMQHIFESFWRHDEAHQTPGFGLGLPIARRAIELHKGSIFVESEEGKGTRVTITLPLPQPVPANPNG